MINNKRRKAIVGGVSPFILDNTTHGIPNDII